MKFQKIDRSLVFTSAKQLAALSSLLAAAYFGVALVQSPPDIVQDDPALRVDFPAEKSRLKRMWSSKEIDRVEVTYIHTNTHFRINVSSSMLLANYDFKAVDRYRSGSAFSQGLLAAVDKTQAQESGKVADLRWGCVFYDSKSKAVFSIFFDRTGRSGVVNGACVNYDSEDSLKWLFSKYGGGFN
jgi:hypothetical protein